MHRLIQIPPASQAPARSRRSLLVLALLPFLIALKAPPARADAFLEATHDLVAGWNLIYLPVEPVIKDPRLALAAIDWESLWTWLPSAAEPRGGRWLALYRDAPSFLNAPIEAAGTGPLFSLSGPNSYLLLTHSGGTLRIKGAVRPDRQSLASGTYQLFGPNVEQSNPPSFASYFSRAGVKEHIGSVFELSGQTYRRVQSNDPLRAGAAYWVSPDQVLPTPSPIRLGVGLNGLRFDAETTVQDIVLDVGTTTGGGGGGGVAPRQLMLRALPSVGNSSDTSWLEFQKSDGTFAGVGDGATVEALPDQSVVRVTFRAQSQGLAIGGGGNQAAVVELLVPEGKVSVGAELEVPGLKGIWLGDATITEVERPSFHGGGFAEAPAVSVSLILEIPSVGPSRLLPCVSVESARDGRKVNYRLSAALFPEIVGLAGTVASDGKSGNLTGTMALSADHPLNPYRHRYHPEHGLGIDVTRSVKLRFGANGPDAGPVNPLVEVGVVTGAYEEEINGISAEPIRTRGTFRLRRVVSGNATPCSGAGQ